MKTIHGFHIPVMGTGFSIDTPIKVARYGISSVISLVDDHLIEDMRKFYCEKTNEPYRPITKYDDDYRARRITEYLNLIERIVQKQFAELKSSNFEEGTEITKYFELLSEESPLKILYYEMLLSSDPLAKEELQQKLRDSIHPGDINVNIMTKLDHINYAQDGSELPIEYSDALSALRGYAKSTLTSSIIFSAGINMRLYSYMEKFADFYSDEKGFIKKKIVLKVSDYRSSIIQGKFLAKKGLWVSEYRIESGLNCGGHCFPSDGYLMGPMLEEFKNRKTELIESLHKIYNQALLSRNRKIFVDPPAVRITAQGGIGTVNEDKFLRSYYQLDGTGWATPFLLVPEATNVDEVTLKKLAAATEDDLYLSDVSPLGFPFNNLRDSLSDMEKERRVTQGRPGSACPKGYLVSDTEFTPKPICTASRLYQKLKIDQLSKLNLNVESFKKLYDQVVKKACICTDLGESVLIKYKAGQENHRRFPAICPGPNLAYFSKIATLKEMVDHIYGRINLLNSTYRPNMFIKELKMYVEYFQKNVQQNLPKPTEQQVEYFNEFVKNLFEGIDYYKKIIPQMMMETKEYHLKMMEELLEFRKRLEVFIEEHKSIFSAFKIPTEELTLIAA